MRIKQILNNIRQQNFIGLLLDFIVVVGGIFVGLLASEWNQDRLDKKRELTLVQRIHSEISESVARNNRFLTRLEESAETGNSCLMRVYSKTLTESDAKRFMAECFYPHMYSEIEIDGQLSVPSLLDLVDSGGFKTVSNDAVRNSLFKYLRSLEVAKEQEMFIRELFLPSLNYFQQNIRRKPGYKLNLSYEITYERLLNDERLYNHMNNTYTLRNFGFLVFSKTFEEQKTLKSELDNYLAQH